MAERQATTARRPYVMRDRADAVAATRERIVRSTIEAAYEQRTLEVTLQDVADRAGVSVQTVLRHFGTREGLLDAAQEVATAEVVAERRVRPGDVRAAVRAVVDHYERMGDFVVAMLAEAQRTDRARAVTEPGMAVHRSWVSESFAPQLAGLPPGEAGELTDLLVVVTDVYAWVLLRRDRGLSRHATLARMQALVEAVLARCAGARGDGEGGVAGGSEEGGR